MRIHAWTICWNVKEHHRMMSNGENEVVLPSLGREASRKGEMKLPYDISESVGKEQDKNGKRKR